MNIVKFLRTPILKKHQRTAASVQAGKFYVIISSGGPQKRLGSLLDHLLFFKMLKDFPLKYFRYFADFKSRVKKFLETFPEYHL